MLRKLLIGLVALFLFVFIQPTNDSVYANTLLNIGFEPYDSVLDPVKPVVYLTKLGSRTVYAVNYETTEIKTLTLSYPANRVELYQNQLVFTQHKMSHDMYNFGPYEGAIALVDLDTFTTNTIFDVEADPYDIAIDKDGYLYITPGSGQWEDMQVYSLQDKSRISNSNKANMRNKSSALYNAETNKIYSISTEVSPRDVDAFEINQGVIRNNYDSPYHGDYWLMPHARISPDGLKMYNASGIVFGLAALQMGDMSFEFDLGKSYNDYAFSLNNQLMFAANSSGGTDVYSYPSDDYLYTIKKGIIAKRLDFNNNGLLLFYSENNRHYLEYITEFGPSSTEGVNPVLKNPLLLADSAYYGTDGLYQFGDGTLDIPIDTAFIFEFDQPIQLLNTEGVTVSSSYGPIEIYDVDVSDNLLFVEPDYLEEDQLYTITVEEDMVAGLADERLHQSITMQFRTAKNDLFPPFRIYPGFWSVQHRHPVARLHIRQTVPLLKKEADGSYRETSMLRRGEYYRTYGVEDQYYHVGGGYYVQYEYNKMNLLIGRLAIRNETTLYSPDGKPYRKIKTNELIRVYNITHDRFEVGGGYYIPNDSHVSFFVGFVTLLQDTMLYAPDGTDYRKLKKGETYRVYSLDGTSFDVGGGYYLLDDRTKVKYMKN